MAVFRNTTGINKSRAICRRIGNRAVSTKERASVSFTSYAPPYLTTTTRNLSSADKHFGHPPPALHNDSGKKRNHTHSRRHGWRGWKILGYTHQPHDVFRASFFLCGCPLLFFLTPCLNLSRNGWKYISLLMKAKSGDKERSLIPLGRKDYSISFRPNNRRLP